MATSTIEERALEATMHCVVNSAPYFTGYMDGATEQDTIARAEERERCIKAAQKWLCSLCSDNHYCDHNAKECYQCDALREEMEKD